jgi:O-antigen ligase/polysaccharide polymerase Wzy-like membrane protein
MAAPRTEPRSGEGESSESQPAAAAPPPLPSRSGEIPVSVAIAAIACGVFVWWAWKQAGYFGTVFFPGAMILYALLILLLLAAPFNARLNGPARVALAALIALGAWTLLSILWTNDHDAAVKNAEHTMLYATAFALGIWSSNLAGQRMQIPLAAVAVTGAAIGVVTTVTLASGTDVSAYVHSDATLRFPIGYRNAEAAFLLICLWPTIVLAAEGDLPWQLRALAIGAATMLLELAVLSESRGSLPAAAVALTVFVALSPRRLRAATYLALAAVPVLPALPTLLDVFQHGHGGPGLLPLLRDSARVIALTSLGSVALAAICIRGVEFRLDLGRERVQLLSRIVAVLTVATVVVGGTVFVAKRGGPINFLDQRVSEFKKVGYPNLQRQGTRFGANVGSNRHDFWRVAVDEAGDHPLLGGGAGSFATAYLKDRKSDETPRDPHSVEMLTLSELGLVGLLLLGFFLVASAWADVRAWRLGPAAAALVAGSLASGAYWLVHASYDWFWLYPGVTAPAIFLLGAAAAPPLLDRGVGRPGRGRLLAVPALALALLITVPLFFSQRYANRAYDEYPGNPSAALSDLDRAADLDPYDPEPLLAKGLIDLQLGRGREAVVAFRNAADRQPAGYAAHYFLARALAPTNPAAARAEAAEALRLNPLDPRVRHLARSLQGQRRL